MLLKVAGDI